MELIFFFVGGLFAWAWWERKKQALAAAKEVFFLTVIKHFSGRGIFIHRCFSEGRWWIAVLQKDGIHFSCFMTFDEQHKHLPQTAIPRWTAGSILTEDYCASGGYGADAAISSINKNLLT